MANRRTRRANRKSRRANRRSRRAYMMGGKKTRRNNGLFSKIYSPVSHLIQATGNAVGTVTNTTRNIAKKGLTGVNNIGKSVTGHANSAVRNLVSRKRKSRRAGRR